MLSNTFKKFVLTSLTILASLQLVNAQTMMPLPPHAYVYSGAVRGYWFTAPVDFTIVGLRVAKDAGGGAQYMEVIKINDASPVVYPVNSNNFTSLKYIQGATNGVIQPVNIPITKGDKIGVFGTASTSNSYGSVTGPTNIDGNPVTLARILYQGNITGGGIPNYSTEPASSYISRVELYYITDIPCDDTLESAVVLGPNRTCPKKPYSLSIGISNGTHISGLTYQWQYSYDGTSWSNFTGVPNVNKGGLITDSTTQDKWYRCKVTCTATKETYITPPHKVKIAPFYYCYCDNMVTVDKGVGIGNVKVISMQSNDTVLNYGNATPLYKNPAANKQYSANQDSVAWPCLYRDSTYKFAVTQISSSSAFTASWVQAYIDYNRDGVFNYKTERLFSKALDGSGNPAEIFTETAKVPGTAEIGLTGLRVIISEDSVEEEPCDTISGNGEVEDYIIEICYRPCDGPVNAGIALSTDTSMCTDYEYVLTDTTYEKHRSAFNWTWQTSGDNINWFPINNSFKKDTLQRVFIGQPLYYRIQMVCPGTNDTTYSQTAFVNVKPGYKCYCYSKALGGLNNDTSDIGGITIGSFNSNSGGPHVLNGKAHESRTDYTDNTPLEFYVDSIYSFYVYHTLSTASHGDAKITVFMDFNNNHEYDIPEERVYTGFTSIGTHTLVDSVVIPQKVIPDVPTGMRFILNNDVGPNVPSDSACGGYESGETEDFIVIFRKKGTIVSNVTKLNGFGIFPNPSKGAFNIQFQSSTEISDVHVAITNITGQTIFTGDYKHKGGMFNQKLDLTGQPSGVYIVELQADGQKLVRKLTIDN